MASRRIGNIRLAGSQEPDEPLRGASSTGQVVRAVHATEQAPLSFTLILATINRVSEVAAFLEALTMQKYPHLEVIVVDQNVDGRIDRLLNRYSDALKITHLHSKPGLSRARNVGLRFASGDIIAFPDDDCIYPPDLLESVAAALAPAEWLDGISVLPRNAEGEPFPRMHKRSGKLHQNNVFRRCVSVGLFLRAEVIRRTGEFNEALGLGAETPWASAEDVDYPLRALLAGCRLEYRTDIHVVHAFGIRGNVRQVTRRGYNLGGGVGYVLKRHRFSLASTIEILVVRPAGGLLLGALRGSLSEVGFYAGSMYGKVRGWLKA